MQKFNKFPRSAGTNYKRLRPFLDAVDALEERQFTFHVGESIMPLSIEYLHDSFQGMPIYSMMHYYTQNGDMMRDPDITFAVDHEGGRILPLTYQQDGCPFTKYGTLYQEVFPAPGQYVPGYLSSIDTFLRTWTQNIIDQGFSPDEPARTAPPVPDPIPLPAAQEPARMTFEEFTALVSK